jgi:membrane-bound serine protease (ClpP class)
MRRWAALAVIFFSAFLFSASVPAGGPGAKGTSAPEIKLLEIDGVINPLTARYLSRELKSSASAELIIVLLDTPGGLETSMREMSQAMLGSPVPIVVYVSPSGARAASAGMFLTIAAHVAAMAPGTNIGAAHPVGLQEGADLVKTEKAASDAAALARAIAQARGRNAAWVERAVRESVSSTAEEALREGVIDLVAGDLETLLQELDGRKVTTTAGEITLRTRGAQVIQSSMRLPERILHAITDPNIAYLLFTLGLIGLAAEIYSPGLLFPGIVGAVSLVLAFVAFGSLPLNWAGLALIVLAVGLLIAELLTQGIGILGVGGVAAFVIGSLMLYSPPGAGSPLMPAVRVSPWLIGVMAAVIGGFFLLILRAVLRAPKAVVTTGVQGLVGSIGVATSELAPKGTVHLKSETWRAKAVGEPIHAGEAVKVTSVEGVTLVVTRQPPVATA